MTYCDYISCNSNYLEIDIKESYWQCIRCKFIYCHDCFDNNDLSK